MADQPIPFTVTDPDRPLPYRLRVHTASAWLRDFIVPKLGIRPMPRRSAARRRV